ncbi:calcium-binding protein [Rubrobacter indicoceani]|uniref:calcium-binding protein n=1 Tax=Rubrobacter indicoceani TaxID=2051957 RepID=UPI001F098024|nr:calcium-binding protein [Rubrobacter indicoceani]
MRKIGLLLMAMAMALLLASGIAYAKSIVGNSKDNRLIGTNQNDTIAGGGGNDFINGKAANDRLYGDSGSDIVSGGVGNDDVFGGKGADKANGNGGNDYINVADNRLGDVVDCGPGEDTVVFDADFQGKGVSLETADFGGNTDDVFDGDCENFFFVPLNPESGTDSEENMDMSRVSQEQVGQAVENGTLIEVE